LLETASAIPNCNPRTWYNLGLLYQATGQNEKCVATLQKGLSLQPCNYDMLYALFAFYMNQHDRVKAAPCIEKLRNCFPNEKTVRDLYNEFENRR
jgi:Tfp pilus assembly protein PilF